MKICMFLVTIQAHILYSKFWPAFFSFFFFLKGGLKIFQKKCWYRSSRVLSLEIKWLTHLGDRAPTSLHFMTHWYMCIYNMTVKAKIWVRGGRQINYNKIPDIWQMAVRRFSRVQSMPSCLYEVYRAHWTKEVAVTSLKRWTEDPFVHWKKLSFQINSQKNKQHTSIQLVRLTITRAHTFFFSPIVVWQSNFSLHSEDIFFKPFSI